MTVNTEKSYQKYVGNGYTNIFSVPFDFLDDEIVVFKGNTLELYEKGVDYTLASNDVVFYKAPEYEEVLYITRSVVLTQLVDFINGENFPAENYEYSLDHITHALQELSLWVKQSWKSPLGTDPIEAMDKLIRSYVGENLSEKVAEIEEVLANKANISDVYTKEQVNTRLDLKADEIDLKNKADKEDVYTKSEVDGIIGDIGVILDNINGEVV